MESNSSAVEDSVSGETLVRTDVRNRQARVKARKQRDMEALKRVSATKELLSERHNAVNLPAPPHQLPSDIPPITIIAPPRNPKRRNVSQDLTASKKNACTLSQIMVVASLLPYTGIVHISDLASPRDPHQEVAAKESGSSIHDRSVHDQGQQTSPPSLTSKSSESGSTAPPITPQFRSVDDRRLGSSPCRPTSVRSVSSGSLAERRRNRRLKRNMSLREKELDARLAKIELEHSMLMTTLGGIARNFVELDRVLPLWAGKHDLKKRESVKRGHFTERSVDESQRGERKVELAAQGDLMRRMASMESLMRGLQGAAGRVSGESFRRVNAHNDFDDDDGTSIL